MCYLTAQPILWMGYWVPNREIGFQVMQRILNVQSQLLGLQLRSLNNPVL